MEAIGNRSNARAKSLAERARITDLESGHGRGGDQTTFDAGGPVVRPEAGTHADRTDLSMSQVVMTTRRA